MMQIVHNAKAQKKSIYQLDFEQECDRVFESIKKELAPKLAILEAHSPGYTERLKKKIFQP